MHFKHVSNSVRFTIVRPLVKMYHEDCKDVIRCKGQNGNEV